MGSKARALLFFLAIAALAGCRGSQPVVHTFYVLEKDTEQLLEWPERISGMQGSCEIATVRVAPAYAGQRIAVREDSHQIRYFTFNEWAVRPELDFTRMLLDYMDAHRVFDAVYHGRVAISTDYLMETQVVHLELDSREESFRARLHVEFRLLDARGQVIKSHVSDTWQPLPRKSVNDFAQAVSEMFVDALHAFAVDTMQGTARNQ